jgi:hypothetical protein
MSLQFQKRTLKPRSNIRYDSKDIDVAMLPAKIVQPRHRTEDDGSRTGMGVVVMVAHGVEVLPDFQSLSLSLSLSLS